MASKLTVISNSLHVQKPPRKLGRHGMALWQRITNEYGVEDAGGVEMLAQGCAALDRAEACGAQIEKDGEMLRTKTGLKEHPLLKHELAARSFVVRTLQRLGLDVEAIKPIGRPAGGGYRGDEA
jgi:hypothetical protein